jgi:hypothetical protein
MGNATLVPLRVAASFADINFPGYARIAAEINRAASLMIVEGIGNQLFDPSSPVTTQAAAAMLLRAIGVAPTWGAVMKTAGARGLIAANAEPNASMARIGAASIIAKILKDLGMKPTISPEDAEEALKGFTDTAGLTAEQKADLAICVKLGVFQGMGGTTMNPGGAILRSQMASIAVRLQDAILGQ